MQKPKASPANHFPDCVLTIHTRDPAEAQLSLESVLASYMLGVKKPLLCGSLAKDHALSSAPSHPELTAETDGGNCVLRQFY